VLGWVGWAGVAHGRRSKVGQKRAGQNRVATLA
jgi:hypothetical protein